MQARMRTMRVYIAQYCKVPYRVIGTIYWVYFYDCHNMYCTLFVLHICKCGICTFMNKSISSKEKDYFANWVMPMFYITCTNWIFLRILIFTFVCIAIPAKYRRLALKGKIVFIRFLKSIFRGLSYCSLYTVICSLDNLMARNKFCVAKILI